MWQEARKYVAYAWSLSTFTITTLLLIPGLAIACYHQRELQVLRLTTTSNAPGGSSGGLNATGGGGNDYTYNIYLWYYCVTGLVVESGQYLNVTDSCHQTKQALTEHILPSLNSTFKPSLPRPDINGPIREIADLFQNYAYPAFASYVTAILLLLIFAGLFIWWFGATVTPHKKTLSLILCIFTGWFAALAALQTYLCYQTIYIITQSINLSKSTLSISIQPGYIYLLIVHIFWLILLINTLIIPISSYMKRSRARRKIEAEEAEEAESKRDLEGDTKVCNTPAEPAEPAESAQLDNDSSSDESDEWDRSMHSHSHLPPQGYPHLPPQGYPQYPPQGYPQYPPQGYPQYPPQNYWGPGYSQVDPNQEARYRRHLEKRHRKAAKREQARREERTGLKGGGF